MQGTKHTFQKLPGLVQEQCFNMACFASALSDAQIKDLLKSYRKKYIMKITIFIKKYQANVY
jgi:hypothetical protein